MGSSLSTCDIEVLFPSLFEELPKAPNQDKIDRPKGNVFAGISRPLSYGGPLVQEPGTQPIASHQHVDSHNREGGIHKAPDTMLKQVQ
jgi:hypothetical protein